MKGHWRFRAPSAVRAALRAHSQQEGHDLPGLYICFWDALPSADRYVVAYRKIEKKRPISATAVVKIMDFKRSSFETVLVRTYPARAGKHFEWREYIEDRRDEIALSLGFIAERARRDSETPAPA